MCVRVAWVLEVDSLLRCVKSILDAECVAPGVIEVEDVAVNLFGYGDLRE